MCNLYNMTTNHQAMIEMGFLWEKANRNLPPLFGIYPDYFAPIVREADDCRVISFARWGLPSLKDAPTEKPNRGTTNVRHRDSTIGRATSLSSIAASCPLTASLSR
ncbi:MAG: hypothetical protein ABIY37_02745 [Devosia sp.]